ncbi:hypothetical protein [Duganella fentianensis]|uniref:hypothetical protein n=1 Tax=Duganella fentianensis TaxID=2692177 RepID=UPI0032B254C5
MQNEEDLVSARRGKWSVAGVPHKGWECVDIVDMGEPSQECGMCETSMVRYVHRMEHPDYEETLGVGCICAGHMEGNLAASRARESSMKSRAGKRKRWLTRAWKTSATGKRYIVADGYRITVYPKGKHWAATIAATVGAFVEHSKMPYKTMDEVKLAAFDFVTRRLAKDEAVRGRKT